MPDTPLPEWEALLSSAARDHALTDLRTRFDEVLATLESVAGWKTARVRRPVLILGSLDGIETGVRQLIRETPLETEVVEISGEKLTVPTRAEMLRIKAVLIVKRNATRDYLDFVAMSELIGREATLSALATFDSLYPQPNGQSVRQQLQIQLANPMPYDLDETNLTEYKRLKPEYQDWDVVSAKCREVANALW